MDYKKISFKKVELFTFLIFLITLISFHDVYARLHSNELVSSLRNNVVMLDVEWEDGSQHQGVGFIISEYYDGLLIITANSIVRGNFPGTLAKIINIKYFSSPNRSDEGNLLEVCDKINNIAVITTSSYFSRKRLLDVNKNSIGCSSIIEVNTPVWFIGRSDAWYIPDKPGKIKSRFIDRITLVEDLNISLTSLGAPVITNTGIIGMIIDVLDNDISKIISIDQIQRDFEDWNLPWQLARALKYPCQERFTSDEIRYYPDTEEGLLCLIEELFQPGVSWESIFEELYPYEEDLSMLIGDTVATEFYFREQREAPIFIILGIILSKKNKGFDGGLWYNIVDLKSSPTDPTKKAAWIPDILKIASGLTVYSCRIGSKIYSGFIYINGHWVYIPMNFMKF